MVKLQHSNDGEVHVVPLRPVITQPVTSVFACTNVNMKTYESFQLIFWV